MDDALLSWLVANTIAVRTSPKPRAAPPRPADQVHVTPQFAKTTRKMQKRYDFSYLNSAITV